MFVPIIDELPNTISLGTFETYELAMVAVYCYYTKNQSKIFHILEEEFLKEFDQPLDWMEILDNEDYSEFVRDRLSFAIEELPKSVIFDFRKWRNWDMDSLYLTLHYASQGIHYSLINDD